MEEDIKSLKSWVWLASLRELRAKSRRMLLERFGGAEAVCSADTRELERQAFLRPEEREALFRRDISHAEKIISRCRELGIAIHTCRDPAFPQALLRIPDPPLLLYALGRLPPLDTVPCIALVGTRRGTPYGEKMAEKLGADLARLGVVLLSGMTAGIDSAGVRGALSEGGTVIGVQGVAINRVYPKDNAALFHEVCASGAVVSEYPPDENGGPFRFRMRNRVIAGISNGVVVVQAPERSGALLIAGLAVEYGRELFAVPGNSDVAESRGSNRLLRNCATLVESGEDILQEFRNIFPDIKNKLPPPERTRSKTAKASKTTAGKVKPRFPPGAAAETIPAAPVVSDVSGGASERQFSDLDETALRVVSVMTEPEMQVDEIISKSGLAAKNALSELLFLQLKGYVIQTPGKRFSLNIAVRPPS